MLTERRTDSQLLYNLRVSVPWNLSRAVDLLFIPRRRAWRMTLPGMEKNHTTLNQIGSRLSDLQLVCAGWARSGGLHEGAG